MARRNSFVYVIDLTKNTVDTEKVTTTPISGIVRQILIDIPSGWNYSAGIRFEFGDKVFPRPSINSEKYYTGDETDIPLKPNLSLKEEELKIYGINNDTVNDHSCIVTIEVEELEVIP